jgi:aconitate hydratase
VISGLSPNNKRNAISLKFDVNPSSRQVLENLMEMGALGPLIAAGGRLHQSGCMGCIGMGQAPATNTISLRTMPEIFQDVPAH